MDQKLLYLTVRLYLPTMRKEGGPEPNIVEPISEKGASVEPFFGVILPTSA